MKPTVISNSGGSNGSSSGNPPQSHPAPGNIPNNNAMNANSDGNNNPNIGGGSRQQFPHFQGFGFDPDMDDMFSDAGIRSRLNRMPFDFGTRKRCNEPHTRYFDDEADFFPNFGSLGRRRQQPSTVDPSNPRAGIFEHIPAEFRQYMPDAFEFPTARSKPQTPRSAPTTQPQYPPQYPQQYYEGYVQPSPGSPTASQPQPQKPKLCDAAIQTENPAEDETDKPTKGKPLKQHGLRNTVDLGQISPPENSSSPRAQSAPPNDPSDQPPPEPNNGQQGTSTAYVYIPPPQKQNNPQQRWQAQGQQTSAPQPQQGHHNPHPPPRSPHPQYYQSSSQPQQPQPQSPTGSQAGFQVRTVPIFVEGRSDPIINEHKHFSTESQPQNQHQQQPQRQYHPQQQQPPQQHAQQNPQQQQPQSHYQPYHQYQAQQQSQSRPTPLNTQQANAAPTEQGPVPSTPQTTETINKIQSIQRDVLDLMSKVEKFAGMKGDKEYMYLDEMLTRNLLKLDTIDTQGKERIRLARKEAIKCIQASINVLEAKAEENAKTARESVMKEQESNTSPESEATTAVINEDENLVGKPKLDEASTAKLPDVVPLPPPPERPSKKQELKNPEVIALPASPELQQINQEVQEQGKDSNEPIKEENPKTDPKPKEPTSKDEVQKTEEQVTETVATNVPANESKKEGESEQSPTKEERSKESPKKKIIKKIVKKLEKKDKKGSGSPPSKATDNTKPETESKTTKQEEPSETTATSAAAATEVSN